MTLKKRWQQVLMKAGRDREGNKDAQMGQNITMILMAMLAGID